MADEIKLNQEQFNAILEKLDSIDTTFDKLDKIVIINKEL